MITILFFFLGTCLGSFLGLVFYRYPEKSIILPKSYCDTCSHPLRYRDLIPIFSYLLNRAKCPFCHTKVRILYLFIEVFCGVFFTSPLSAWLILG
ncbi:prepilin peptidase [Streptococcus didelphis]|uniref:prepilin peptidase n=1 Tax=Streptococcus didelphis TaxID=102886 RepID=UPI0027D2327D|nr:prepilin peptidase [Streptococcus didelphis]WMB29957.1 prepilin peptidase [Streptococcus didelphis]